MGRQRLEAPREAHPAFHQPPGYHGRPHLTSAALCTILPLEDCWTSGPAGREDARAGLVERPRSKVLTVADAAKQKGIPRSTLYWLIKEGLLPAYKEAGKRKLFLLPEDVDRLEELKAARVLVLNPVNGKSR